jgi:TP901-1 family phage major tail protein
MPTTLTNGLIGRRAVLKKAGNAIANLITKSVSINSEPVDITTDTSAGFRQLLAADSGLKTVEISAEGILKNNSVIDDVLAQGTSATYDFEFGTETKKLSGTFHITSVEIGAPMNEAITVSLTLQSSGAITHQA